MYIYATREDGRTVRQPLPHAGSRAQIGVEGEAGKRLSLTQTTNYPWDGDVRMAVDPESQTTFDVRVRVPAWCRGSDPLNGGLYSMPKAGPDAFRISINGEPVASPTIIRGYAVLHRQWRAGDKVHIRMAMPGQLVRADDRVESDRGRAALMRGPIVYCLESHDNEGRVRDVWLPERASITSLWRPELLGGVTIIRAAAERLPLGGGKPFGTDVVAIPYYANANRGPAEMIVWLPTTSSGATRPTIASLSTPTASHCFVSDTVDAMNDGVAPKNSSDETCRRFTWWDRRGTDEWVQYDFGEPRRVGGTSVYWWDDSRLGRHCAAPLSWRLLFRKPDGTWEPVRTHDEFGTKLDTANKVEFEPVETTAIRIEAKLRPNLSAGILEWQVIPAASAPRAYLP